MPVRRVRDANRQETVLGVNGDLLTRCGGSSVMFDLFSDEMRRNPYPVYDRMRDRLARVPAFRRRSTPG